MDNGYNFISKDKLAIIDGRVWLSKATPRKYSSSPASSLDGRALHASGDYKRGDAVTGSGVRDVTNSGSRLVGLWDRLRPRKFDLPLPSSERIGQIGGSYWYQEYVRPCVSEFIGTTMFIYLLCMGHNSWEPSAPIAPGFVLYSIINITAHVSGGHVNPAITIGVLLAGQIRPLKAFLYVVSQLAGSLLSAVFYKLSVPEPVYANTTGATTQFDAFQVSNDRPTSPGEAFFIEMILTSVLVLTVQVTALDSHAKHPNSPLAAGITVSGLVIIGYRYTGGVMNPARSFGPTVYWLMNDITSDISRMHLWETQYIYWLASLTGTMLAAVIFRLLLASSPSLGQENIR